MGETVSEGSGVGRSVEESSNGQYSLSGEALSKWRSSGQVENGTPSTSPSYWDTDDDEDYGLKPSQLFAKHKWKIEKYSEIKKRELRSSVFDAGGYKWYILIYPQGCDVCNHLSLFLCVANHDKLLPGWSHFAQFTIAVVNKDPKKSKFSDTLHRFWKKEHDWGWKKFIELPKLHDGFLDDSDSLTIEAQVQVIRERVDRPFRCLHCGYRRELVRVYLANVVQNCRHFVEEKRSKLERLIEDKARWTSFGVFWLGMDQSSRRLMSREKMDVILKGVVKHFFIEKEVTATLVMDFLYSGLKALEGQTKNKKSRPKSLDAKELPAPIVSVDKDTFVLADDVLLLLERAALEPLPPNPKEDKGPRNRTKDVNDGEEDNSEAVERDERRLTELGRRTVEIFVLSHIFNKIEVAYHEAISLKRQEALIREEEEEWLAETELRAKRGAAGREKKSKKKQAKQKRNKNKGKDKRKEEDLTFATHEKDLEENQHDEEEKDFVTEKAESQAEKTDTLGDVSDISDSVDGSADILHPDLEDRDTSSVHWDTDALEIHPPPIGGSSTSISAPNGIADKKNQSTMDDSSSTCSNDSVRSGVTNGSYKGNALNFRNQKSPNKGKNQQVKIVSDARSLVRETEDQPRSQNSSPESDWVVVSHNQEPESSWNRSPVVKERNVAQVIVNSVDMDRPKGKSAAVLTSPRTVAKDPSPPTQTKLEKRSVSMPYAVTNKKVMPASVPPSSTQVVPPSSDIQSQAVGLRADMQKIPLPKQPATTTITRPSSAPVIPAVQPAPITVSSVQPSTSFPRSVSSAGRLGPDSSLHNQQTYTPQSYKHAIVGNSPGSSSSFNHHPSPHGVIPTTLPSASYSQTPTSSYQSSFPFSQDGPLLAGRSLNSVNMGMNNPYTPTVTSNSSLNHIEIGRQQSQNLMTDEFPHLDIINDLLEDENCSSTVFNGSTFNSQPQMLNRQYSYHGGGGGADLGISGQLLSGGRSRSFGEERFHYMSHGGLSAAGPYADGLIPTQWQMANMDLSLLGMRNNSNMEDTTSYHNTYFGLDSSNPSFSSGINGYTEFRPSNGH